MIGKGGQYRYMPVAYRHDPVSLSFCDQIKWGPQPLEVVTSLLIAVDTWLNSDVTHWCARCPKGTVWSKQTVHFHFRVGYYRRMSPCVLT